jgi:hypothetical protein
MYIMYIHIYVCMCVGVCVCMHVYIYVCVRTYVLTSAQYVHVQFVRSVFFVHLEVEQSRGVRAPYYLESKVRDPRYEI